MCEEQPKLYDWLTGFGVEFRAESLLATNGHSRPREHLNNDGPAPLTLDHPPYYAFGTTNVICCTYGGLKIDANQGCQVVNVFDEVIPNLYAAGNVSGYSNMGCEPGTRIARNASGTGFGGALAFGRYCANQIAEQEDWDPEAVVVEKPASETADAAPSEEVGVDCSACHSDDRKAGDENPHGY